MSAVTEASHHIRESQHSPLWAKKGGRLVPEMTEEEKTEPTAEQCSENRSLTSKQGENRNVLRQATCASLLAQTVKNLPAMRETWVQSNGWEDPLEEGMATHSSILAWRILWTEEPGYSRWGSQRVTHNWVTKHMVLGGFCYYSFILQGLQNYTHCMLMNQIGGSPCGSAGKDSACKVEDVGLFPGLGRSRGEVKGYPLQNKTGFLLGACKKVLSTIGISLSGQAHKDYMNMISVHLRWGLLISTIVDEETKIQRG